MLGSTTCEAKNPHQGREFLTPSNFSKSFGSSNVASRNEPSGTWLPCGRLCATPLTSPLGRKKEYWDQKPSSESVELAQKRPKYPWYPVHGKSLDHLGNSSNPSHCESLGQRDTTAEQNLNTISRLKSSKSGEMTMLKETSAANFKGELTSNKRLDRSLKDSLCVARHPCYKYFKDIQSIEHATRLTFRPKLSTQLWNKARAKTVPVKWRSRSWHRCNSSCPTWLPGLPLHQAMSGPLVNP